MQTRGFVVLLEDLEKTKRLNDADFRQWVTACVRYMALGEYPDENTCTPVALNSFDFTLPRMEKNIEQMEAKAEVNRRNGAKGGRPPKDKSRNPENPNGYSGLNKNPVNPEEPIPIPTPIPIPNSTSTTTTKDIFKDNAPPPPKDEDLTDEEIMEKYENLPYGEKPPIWYNAKRRIYLKQMDLSQ